MGLAAAQDHVLDLRGVETGSLAEDMTNRVGGEIVGTRPVERSAIGLRKWCARTCNDDGFAHG